MSAVPRSIVIFALGLFSQSVTAQYAARCSSASQQSVNQCMGAFNAMNAADQASSSAANAAAGNNINQNSGTLNNQLGQQLGRIASTKSTCEAAEQKCKSACQSAQAQAQAAMSPEAGTIPGIKSSQCEQPIEQAKQQLDQAANNLNNNSNQAQNTGQQSSGGMPQSPSPSPSPQEQAESVCGTADAYRYSTCDTQMVSQCTGNYSDDACVSFINRYCSSAVSSGTSTSVSTSGGGTVSTGAGDLAVGNGMQIQSANAKASAVSATAALVTDATGEGLGSAFCQSAGAYRFCASSGNASCASCMSGGNPAMLTTSQLTSAQSSCPADPAFLNPEVISKLQPTQVTATDTNATSAPISATGTDLTAASSGSTSGLQTPGQDTGQFGVATGTDAPRAAAGVAEAKSKGTYSIASYGGAGGSGGGYAATSAAVGMSGEEDHSRRPSSFSQYSNKEKAVMPAAPVEGFARQDVSNTYGPSVFAISSGIYRDMCTKGKLLHCHAR